jgi:hypothetical protein
VKIYSVILLFVLTGSSFASGLPERCNPKSFLSTLFDEDPFNGDPLHTVTHIRKGANPIPGEHFSDYAFQSGVDGEVVRVRFSADAKAASVPAPAMSHTDLNQLVEAWMDAQHFSATTRDMIRPITLKQAADPEFAKGLAKEIDFHHAKQKTAAIEIGHSSKTAIGDGQASSNAVGSYSGPGISLSNTGIERYLWLKPEGSSQMTAARVLDIHRHSDKKGYSVLVEYLNEAGATSQRVRNVAEVSLDELKTAQIDHQLFSRERAYQEFLEDLTPNEAQAKKTAQKAGLKMYGYTDFRRIAENEGRQMFSDAITPMQMMNNMTHLAMDGATRQRFGSFESLYHLRPSGYATDNMIDAFSQLNPQYVLKNFSAQGFEYTWVITEDGALKIIPKMPVNNNLKPQLLRAAGGRRIYAGGDFTINADGTLKVRTHSNSYQEVNHDRFGFQNSYADGNPNLDQFVHDTFAQQAKAKVSNLESETASSFGTQAGQNSYRANYREETHFETGKKAAPRPSQRIVWDPEKNQTPLSFEDWAKKTGMPASSDAKTTWAHYVLNSDPNMKLSEIQKTRYRPLAKKFHPDLNPGQNTDETQKAINDAMDIIRDSMK